MVKKFVFFDVDSSLNSSSEDLAKVIVSRLGIIPRKNNATAKMYKILIELYERRKLANQRKMQQLAVMTVEEMALFAGIKRQTMYDYLERLVRINLIKKASYLSDDNIIKGYMLNGSNIEEAVNQVKLTMISFFDKTMQISKEFQRIQKNEKISQKMKSNF